MPRLVQFANNAVSTLASNITNVATSITLATGTGSRFPSPTGSQYFLATLVNAAGTQLEVVKVTARSGDVLTVTRAQEAISGTAATAYAFSAGDKIEARLTAGLMGGEIDRLEALYNVTVDTFTGAGSAGPFTLTGTPGSKQATLVYVGGVYQEKSTYTLSGTSLTLGDPVPTGTVVEVAYGTPLTIGTPADGTVTTVKIVDAAVTTAKIADTNVTTAKIADANVTPAKLSTGGPSWDSSGNVTGADGNLKRYMFQDTGWQYFNSGTTNALDYTNGSMQRWAPTASSNPTLTISNWPPSGDMGELLIEAVGLASAGTISFPTANWIKSDGTLAASPSAAGVTFQTGTGIDFILFWTRDGGTTVYAKVVR